MTSVGACSATSPVSEVCTLWVSRECVADGIDSFNRVDVLQARPACRRCWECFAQPAQGEVTPTRSASKSIRAARGHGAVVNRVPACTIGPTTGGAAGMAAQRAPRGGRGKFFVLKPLVRCFRPGFDGFERRMGVSRSASPARGFSAMTVWPSGLRRWLKAPVRKGVGSNPTAFNSR